MTRVVDDRDTHMARALLASFQSDPSARLVQATENPLVPYLQGSFNLKRAMEAANAAGAHYDAHQANLRAKAEEALKASQAPSAAAVEAPPAGVAGILTTVSGVGVITEGPDVAA